MIGEMRRLTGIAMRKEGRFRFAAIAIVAAAAPVWGAYATSAIAETHKPNGRQSVARAGSKIANSRGPCLSFRGLKDSIIENIIVGPCRGNGIELRDSHNVTVRNVTITDAAGSGILAIGSSSIEVTESRISGGVTGVNVIHSSGVRVSCNTIEDPRGPIPRGQLVQFNNVTGANNNIICNVGRNRPRADRQPEDAISLYQSLGTAASPIVVMNNIIVGGGPSESGGGIMLGDSGGEHQVAQGNILVDPGQYGIAVSSGNNMAILDNVVLSRQQAFTNVGIYVWNQYPHPCHAISIEGNKVKWINKTGESNPFWDGENCSTIAGIERNDFSAELSPEIIDIKAPAECKCLTQGRR